MVAISSYCFGGATCVRLGSTDLVNSVVICHPGPFTLDQVKAIKVPTAWVCAEGIYQILSFFQTSILIKKIMLSEDMFFPESLRLSSEAVFAERKDKENYIDYELKVYKGTSCTTSISSGYFFTFFLFFL